MKDIVFNEEYIRNKMQALVASVDVNVTEIGPAVGKSQTYITDIISGRQLPSFDGLFKLCAYFGISPAEFFDAEINDPLLARELVGECERLCGNDLKRLVDVLKLMEPKHMDSLLDYLKKIARFSIIE